MDYTKNTRILWTDEVSNEPLLKIDDLKQKLLQMIKNTKRHFETGCEERGYRESTANWGSRR